MVSGVDQKLFFYYLCRVRASKLLRDVVRNSALAQQKMLTDNHCPQICGLSCLSWLNPGLGKGKL